MAFNHKKKEAKQRKTNRFGSNRLSKFKIFLARFFDQALHREDTPYSIDIRHFTKRFGKFKAVNDVTIKVNKGAIHGFIGPNGSGKTTTIKSLVGAIHPTKGKLYLSGYEASSVQAKAKIGYIPESARFPKKISTYDYLVTMAQLSNVKPQFAKELAERALRDNGLWNFQKKNPNSFSSGMKKKVLLAQALMNDPEILILDEPAANLDPTARLELFNSLKELAKQGKTIFISSHILSELQNFVSETTILNFGKVLYSGKVDEEYTNEYLIETSNDAKLYKWLKSKSIKVKKYENELLVTLDNEEERNIVLREIIRFDLNLISWKKYVRNLETLYRELIMNEKLKEGKK